MRKQQTIREDYFLWLYKIVDGRKRSYRKLCKRLYEINFRWSVHNDDNRCEDGIELRDLFIEEEKLDESHLEVQALLKGECNLFEMMVALAQRMNDLTYDLKTQDDKTSKWFNEMICNLDLFEYDDMWIFTPISEAKIDRICDTLMDRTYDWYGRGSLFPMKRRPPKDMAKVEIWYQLMLYLEENHG